MCIYLVWDCDTDEDSGLLGVFSSIERAKKYLLKYLKDLDIEEENIKIQQKKHGISYIVEITGRYRYDHYYFIQESKVDGELKDE